MSKYTSKDISDVIETLNAVLQSIDAAIGATNLRNRAATELWAFRSGVLNARHTLRGWQRDTIHEESKSLEVDTQKPVE